jgi:hypothetical protein
MGREAVEPKYQETITFAKLAAGTVLEGKYVGVREIRTKAGRTALVYEFTDANGEKWEVFGVAALDARMTLIPPGTYIWITYGGKVQGNNGTQRHDVKVEKDSEIPV